MGGRVRLVKPPGRPGATVGPVASSVTLEFVDAQEERFARAFAASDISLARDLYHPDVVYVSPTTRLFGRGSPIEGVDAALEFIQSTIAGCPNIEYRLDERAVLPGGSGAYTRILFDWDDGDVRLRSTYVVVYRYRDGKIARQELYYDPSGELERVAF
jgi:ketosteroid isomerase-like protein